MSGSKKKGNLRTHRNCASKMTRRCIFPALKGATDYFSSKKALLIRNVITA